VRSGVKVCPLKIRPERNVRSAADESQLQDNQPLAVLPGLADAVERLKKPFFKRRLRIVIPTFSMSWIYPKFAGAVATAFLAFIIVQFAFRGTENLESHSKAVTPGPAVRRHIGSPENTGSYAQHPKRPRTKPMQLIPLRITAAGIRSTPLSRCLRAMPPLPLSKKEVPKECLSRLWKSWTSAN
jgi:hypothetical protein